MVKWASEKEGRREERKRRRRRRGSKGDGSERDMLRMSLRLLPFEAPTPHCQLWRGSCGNTNCRQPDRRSVKYSIITASAAEEYGGGGMPLLLLTHTPSAQQLKCESSGARYPMAERVCLLTQTQSHS